MANGMRQILFVLIPAAAAVLVLSEPMIRLVYQRGEFTAGADDPGRDGALLVRLLAADQRPLPAAHPDLLQPPAALGADRDRRRQPGRHGARLRSPSTTSGSAGSSPRPRSRPTVSVVAQCVILRRILDGLELGQPARQRRSGSRSRPPPWPRSASASGTCSTAPSGAASAARSSRSAPRLGARPAHLPRRRQAAADRRARPDRPPPAPPLDARALGRYLLGVVRDRCCSSGFAWLGATAAPPPAGPRASRAPRPTSRPRSWRSLLLIWVAELLGTFGAFEPLPYLLVVGARRALRCWTLLRRVAEDEGGRGRACRPQRPPRSSDRTRRPERPTSPTLIALAIAAVAVVQFAAGVQLKLGTGHDRVRQHLVPRAVRGGVLPERQHLGPALHRAAVPGLVLPGELRDLPRGRDARVRPRPALAAAQPRLVRRLPARLLVHRAAVPGGAVVAGARGDRARACRRSPTRPGRRGTTSSGSSSCSPRSRSRSTPGRGRATARRRGRRAGAGCRPARWSSSGSPPASPPGPSSTSCCPARSSSSAWPRSRRAGAGCAALGGRRPRGSGRRRLLVPAQPRPHRQPAALVRPPRADLAAGARPGAGRPRSAQRARLPDRRHGLVGLVPARPPPRPLARLAAARRSPRSPA